MTEPAHDSGASSRDAPVSRRTARRMRARRRPTIVQLEELGQQQIVFRDRYGAVSPSDRLVLSAVLPDGQKTDLDVVVRIASRATPNAPG